jgi:small subunit ribosomal protein S14
MKSLRSIDLKNRKLFSVSELSQKIIKVIKKNENLNNFQRWILHLNNEFEIKSYKVRLKNSCILTGRNSSISRVYRLSRIQFRELGREGSITGLQKSSW